MQRYLDDIGVQHGSELPSLSRDVLRIWEQDGHDRLVLIHPGSCLSSQRCLLVATSILRGTRRLYHHSLMVLDAVSDE